MIPSDIELVISAKDAEIAWLRKQLEALITPKAPAPKVAVNAKPKKALPEDVEAAIRYRAINDQTESTNRRTAEQLLARGAKPEAVAAIIRKGSLTNDNDDELLAVIR